MKDKEILENAVEFFNGDTLAAQVWFSKYRIEGESSPKDMTDRVASVLWKHLGPMVDKVKDSTTLDMFSDIKERLHNFTFDEFSELIRTFTIIPGGSLLAGLGSSDAVSLSNCFVVSSPKDNYPSIMMNQLKLVEFMKRRGGCGSSLDNIRPKGAKVNNSAKTSTGVVTVMEQSSSTTNSVAQDGRRGALMLTLSVRHPDVMEFIKSKRDKTKITGANISLMMDDPSFMKKVIDYVKKDKDSDYLTTYPINLSVSPKDSKQLALGVLTEVKGGYAKKFKISDIWNEFIHSNWLCADPGIIFKDHQDTYSPSHPYPGFENVCTNPCSEIMMGGEDSCRLLAINLVRFIDDKYTKTANINLDELRFVTYIASLVGDCIVEEEVKHVERILEKTKTDDLENIEYQAVMDLWTRVKDNGLKGRRVGLGITGLGDVYAQLGVNYGDPVTNKVILDSKSSMEWLASIGLSSAYEPFLGWSAEKDVDNEFFKRLCDINPEFKDLVFPLMLKHGRRSVSISTCAPNGSTSILTQTTSGIEPVFMASHMRKRKVADGEEYDSVDEVGCKFKHFTVYHKGVADWMAVDDSDKMTLENPYLGNEAQDIDYLRRVMNQSQIQSYISHSISSTVNLPEDVDKSVISDIYITSWENGLKGITIYRDGSRIGILTANDDKPNVEERVRFVRPEVLPCSIFRMRFKSSENNESEEWLAFLSTHDNKPVEIFTGKSEAAFKLDRSINTGEIIKVVLDEKLEQNRYDFRYTDKDGYRVTVEGVNRCFDREYYNYSKLVSSMLKNNFSTDHVVNVLNRLNLGDSINGWKNGVIRSLQKFIKNGTKTRESCPDCGGQIIYVEGCKQCADPACSYTKCGM